MRPFALVSVLLLAAFALSGCSSGDSQASVYVKDAPTADWKAVHITFTEVSIHQSGGDNKTGWHTLVSDSSGITVDLLNATGTKAAFLGSSGLAAGHYQQIRITVSKAHGIDASGVGHDIGLPQGGELRTSKSFKLESGKETQIVIDFDLEKSLTEKNGQWEFKPVVGKVYAAIKAKDSDPKKGTVETVTLKDDAAE